MKFRECCLTLYMLVVCIVISTIYRREAAVRSMLSISEMKRQLGDRLCARSAPMRAAHRPRHSMQII